MSPVVAALLIGGYLMGLAYLTAIGGTRRLFEGLVDAIRWTGPKTKPREITLEDVAAIGPYSMPEHQIVAWTPVEREAFGINDTQRLIDKIQRELDWQHDVIEIQSWGDSEPVRRIGGGRPNPGRRIGNHESIRAKQADLIMKAAQGSVFTASLDDLGYEERKFEESPTVTGGRIFG